MSYHNHHRPVIIVADDEQVTLDLLCEMLVNLGYDPRPSNNGHEAWEMLQKEIPDLVLTDVMMPIMDGFELCERIKGDRNTRLIPVVLLTGLGTIDDRVRGIEAGADDFISKPFQFAELTARLKSLIKLKQFTDELEHAEQVIFSLALTVEAKDPYTQGHCQRLAYYSVEVGKRLGFNEDELQALRRGGILHDIGKIGIPESILQKAGPLTQEEREIMQSHPEKGEAICHPLHSLAPALPIIRNHHERIDGQGYPDGLTGEEIPIGARIIAVVDYVDALLTDRPYRKALPLDETLDLLENATKSGHLDREIVTIVKQIIDDVNKKWVEVADIHSII